MMGVDLRLLVPLNPHQDSWLVGADIRLERRSELWVPILELPSKPIPMLRGHGSDDEDAENGWGRLHSDDYGKALRFVRAGDLAAIGNLPAARNDDKNVAAFAYVTALPQDWPVVLYWC